MRKYDRRSQLEDTPRLHSFSATYAVGLEHRITVVETKTVRMILNGLRTVTSYPLDGKHVHPRATRHPQQLVACDTPRVGHRWSYTVLVDGAEVRQHTGDVTVVRQYDDGDFASSELPNSADHLRIRRTVLPELWVWEKRSIDVTLRIRTTGGSWDGEWVLAGEDGAPDHFFPDDPSLTPLQWPGIWISQLVRPMDTWRPAIAYASGVWAPLRPEGAGTVTQLILEVAER